MHLGECLRHIACLVLVPVLTGLAGLAIIRVLDLGYWFSQYRVELLVTAFVALMAWLVVTGMKKAQSEQIERET